MMGGLRITAYGVDRTAADCLELARRGRTNSDPKRPLQSKEMATDFTRESSWDPTGEMDSTCYIAMVKFSTHEL